MTTKENSTLLSTEGYLASYIDENGVGVTYFKLNPSPKFGADYTKGCGLLGEDIDKNFYFLRGYDISGVTIDEDRNLIITRVNPAYKPLKVNLAENIEYKFAFDKSTGTLTVTDPNGVETKLDGFLVEGKDIRIATDHTLKGNGTIYKPLGISEIEKTGTYAPANEYLDITETNAIPAEMQKGAGYRIVTKEKVDRFGKLYPFEAVKMIDEKLKEQSSQWRVPTKADWDALLNALEPCEEDRNHTTEGNAYLGRLAGANMKSYEMRSDFEELVGEDPTDGQDAVKLSVYPLGISPFRNSIMRDTDHDTEGFGKLAAMWTSTENADGTVYSKIFGYNTAKVCQRKDSKEAKYSLRLCKEYSYSNFKAEESILGLNYPCELVYSPFDDNDYVMIWTKTNYYDASPTLSGVSSYQWDELPDEQKGTKEVYFINEWNGTEWIKKEMNDGDSVVIINYTKEDGTEVPYHEWRMESEILVDTVQGIMDEFAENLEEINGKIDELSGATVDEIERAKAREDEIDEALDKECERAKAREDEIDAALDTERERAKAREDEIDAALDTERERAKAREDEIDAALDTERERAKTREDEIDAALDTERERAKAREDEIDAALDKECERAKKREQEITDELDAEIARAKKREQEITDELDAEVARAKAAEELEAETRFNNDIKEGTYTIKANESIPVLKNSGVAGFELDVADDFFNFGEF
jgi:uncharacterized protein (TIGR02145 family)